MKTTRLRAVPLSELPPRCNGYVDLRSYAAIGDGRTVALVSHDGSVDWYPIPDLDSAPTFARLLDAEHGGCIELCPDERFEVDRAYLPGTNILQTTYTTASGRVQVTDSLNVGSTGRLPWNELARAVEGLEGTVPMRWRVAPGTMLNTVSPWVDVTARKPVLRANEVSVGVCGEHVGESKVEEQQISGCFRTTPGSQHLLAVVATHSEPLRLPAPREIRKNLEMTRETWLRWGDLLESDGPYGEEAQRSALVLKLLSHSPSGSVAAAATTSLPENMAGTKNYDYRFAWIRDATYALQALLQLGEQEDVHAQVSWLLRLVRAQVPHLHVLNRLNGEVPETRMTEYDVPGWRGTGPVVAGNAAADQLQLGVYGDVFDVAHHYVAGGNVLDTATARMLADLADAICDAWRRPDSGMWELPEHRHYTSSKMGCWHGLDCAVQLAEDGHIPGCVDRWRAERERIRAWIDTECWSEQRGAYVWYPGTEELDASVLLHAMTGFDRGPRMKSTIAALRQELGRGPLLYRYSGMDAEEGAFVACSFWTVAALTAVGQRQQAVELMDRMMPLANDLGLFTEMIDPEDYSFLGNFPQALSHLAVLNAALALRGHDTES
ncbi:glycoside hydrolase family 15 protein [Kocuria sp. cx-116]|uniref:glycoside hydrolase family 15 protein n=1 Tax=Kocuria sp. cx-116 TaxID=2771378 RepID=UPI0016891551|nr:glycoside hydrolase family 15 protein [Kocuria sp. cx-116]MBD2761761.1 glycoside hydrolase family 15 protein [Kocuria sp. cx-116]